MISDDSQNPSPADFAAVDWRRVDTLQWTQPRRFVRRWELNDGDQPVAALRWRGPWRPGFDAVTRGGAWQIDRSFWLGLDLRRPGEEEPEIRVRASWLGRARIERSQGEAVRWRRDGWGFSRRRIETAEGTPLIHFQMDPGFFRHDGQIAIESEARSLPDLEPLILVGWGLLVSAHRQHAH
ncbi:MAG TPA: hypothetical protein VMJ70_11020 [Candidatus Sulfotelmatobacter sp.]|nr:hypothetical protein [Candidatus Sulfotelmatobacter sp.]